MAVRTWTLLLLVFTIALKALFFVILYAKVTQSFRRRRYNAYRVEIQEQLAILFTDCVDEAVAHYQLRISRKIRRRLYAAALEDCLLEQIEERRDADQARQVAVALGLPARSIAEIGSGSVAVITRGCRNAGLYRLEEAVRPMLAALDHFSGEVQFQVLMALSRMGEGVALCAAFQKISSFVLVNERTVAEILTAFSGDKSALYRDILASGQPYLTGVFLKSIDADTAILLSGEILRLLDADWKELRVAAVKAVGRMGQAAPSDRLITALGDEAWEVRAVAAKTIGQLAAQGACPMLLTALCDREWWVRQNAAAALLACPDSGVWIERAMNTGDIYARDSLLHALARVGRQRVRPASGKTMRGAKGVAPC